MGPLGNAPGISRKRRGKRGGKDIEVEAGEQIYVAAGGDMRKFKEICTDCRDRAGELKYSFVDVNLALEFIAGLPQP